MTLVGEDLVLSMLRILRRPEADRARLLELRAEKVKAQAERFAERWVG